MLHATPHPAPIETFPAAESAALDRLTRLVREEIASLAYPNAPWVAPMRGPDGTEVIDVLVVGAGQSGILIAAALKREGVFRTLLVDAAPEGREGPWLTFARMEELRTPKVTVGSDFGLPNLGLRRWFEARHDAATWEAATRVPRTAWAEYLAWYRRVWDLAVENDTRVEDITQAGPYVAVACRSGKSLQIRYARLVVIATGSDGAGHWQVPHFIAANLPRERYDHSNGPIDLGRLAGCRIGILGHGASAFDAAVAAISAGADSVELCFRRKRLPRVNPHRALENAGLMTHYPALSDTLRWQIARHFRAVDQPPAWRSFELAVASPRFHLHAASPWLSVGMDSDAIRVETPHRVFRFDHVIAATGQQVDLSVRPELCSLHARVACWRDRFAPPPAEEDASLLQLPYLGEAYEFLPRVPGTDDWVSRVHAFNSASFVSHGPHSTSISGHRHALPRLVRGLTRRLFLAQEDTLLSGMKAYAEPDLVISDDFEETRASGRTHSPKGRPMTHDIAAEVAPRLRDLPIEELSPAAFASFGTVIAAGEDGIPFGPQDAQLVLTGGTPRFYIMHIPGRGLTIGSITRHRQVTQTLASVGVADWVIAVAPPVAVENPEAKPALESIRAFRIPGDVAIMLHCGTWHAGPLFSEGMRSFFNLELADTNLVDHQNCNLTQEYGTALRLVA